MANTIKITPKFVIKYCLSRKQWCVIDSDGYTMAGCETPAFARQMKRRWFLYFTLKDADRAWAIINGTVDVK